MVVLLMELTRREVLLLGLSGATIAHGGEMVMSVKMSNRIRRAMFPRLHPMDGYIGKDLIPPIGEKRHLIRERGDEYVLSVDCSYDEFVNALLEFGYTNNFLSTLKYVDVDGNRSWEVGSMAYRPDGITGEWMHHAYWFRASESNLRFHIAHHKERNYFDLPDGPTEHTGRSSELYEPYDPDGYLELAVEQAELDYKKLENEEYET